MVPCHIVDSYFVTSVNQSIIYQAQAWLDIDRQGIHHFLDLGSAQDEGLQASAILESPLFSCVVLRAVSQLGCVLDIMMPLNRNILFPLCGSQTS